MKLEDEIKQSIFKNEYQKANINIAFTASWLSQHAAKALKPYGISIQQFNILRILRGMHPKPATIKLLTERMIDKTSNASRLVDKLILKQLVDRRECPMDRRQVDILITEQGLGLLEKASDDLETNMLHYMSGISTAEAATINQLLDKLRK
ncbi:MAG TPA: MarR family transcriptional regulator [Saprospiraceae bacterium]|nr:MarR family transcriptional regulator [Saprospiraceae bacterium]HMQ83600.1 MarR family transcriptional regulator [Saprospiraceae bacterium]